MDEVEWCNCILYFIIVVLMFNFKNFKEKEKCRSAICLGSYECQISGFAIADKVFLLIPGSNPSDT